LIRIFAPVAKILRYILAVFFSAFVLFVQGGFYHIHEHSLEQLTQKCSHDGHHDFTYSDDCDICDQFANQHYTVELPETLEVTRNFLAEIPLFSAQVDGISICLISNRGPPAA
jgi:hypothetical protein